MNSSEFEEQLNSDAEDAVENLITCMLEGEDNEESSFERVVDLIENKNLTDNEEDCLEDNIHYYADNIVIYYSTVNSIFNDCYPYSQEIQDQDDDFGFEYDSSLTYGENVDKIQAVAVYSYYRNKLREVVDSMIDDTQRFFDICSKYASARGYDISVIEKYIDKRNSLIGSKKEEVEDIEERIDDDSKE
jgi:hypothetical protein|tara:strand:+ start:519 stop:1085 length:567 start_codon:yes stop_codon:yes gene_type:complete